MSDQDHEYLQWIEELEKQRLVPVRRLLIMGDDGKPMTDDQIDKELAAGGVSLATDAITVLIPHRDKNMVVEVPWDVASLYPLADVIRHAGFLLARMHTHSPDRIRVHSNSIGGFHIIPIYDKDNKDQGKG